MADLEESLFRPPSSFPPRGIEYSLPLPPPRRKVARGLFLPPRLFGGLSLSPSSWHDSPRLPSTPSPQASPNRGKEEGERAGGRGGYFACCPRRDKNFPFLFLPLFLPLFPSPKFPFPVAAAEYGGQRSYSHR